MSTTRRAKPTMLVLEPRFMFDAAGVATAMDAAANGAPDPVMHDQPAHDAATEQMMAALVEQGAPAHGSTGTRNEIVFVDTRVRDYASIVASVDPRAEVVLIDTDRNGVEQIREALAGREGLDAIHIVSHGDEGVLLLGNSPLHLGNLDAYADSLASIGQALTEDGDIHLYGCDVGGGERGRSFIDALAETTSADIAASDDDTGGDHLGADWDLEIRTGEVTASSAIDVAALASFDYRLEAFSVSNLEDLQEALEEAASNGQDDTITLTADIVATRTDDFTNGFLAYIDLQEDYSLTIVGGGYSLDADYYGRVVYVSEGDKVRFENLTIARGLMSGRGGDAGQDGESSLGAGIANYGDLILRDVTVTANLATGGGGGGGGSGGYVPSEGGGGGGGAVWGRYGGAGGDVGIAKGGIPSYGNGIGGAGGAYQPNAGGGGGSTIGGQGGIGINAGGVGGGAWSNAWNDISGIGGGGGNGSNGTGGAGGGAVGGIYNAAGATLTVVGASYITGNGGAGGGGGGGNVAGVAGRGVGAIWNEGTLWITSENVARMADNAAGSGFGGLADGGVPGAWLDPVPDIYNADTATFDLEYSLPTPVVDANGASEEGTAYTTTFEEDGGAIRIVADDATIALDYDSDIASMTLVLDATPDGTSEGIAYDAALNGNATLDSLGLTGSYDSTTRTYKITGTASAEVYESVLRALVYDNSSQSPGTASRTITITVRDAEGETGKATSTIEVSAQNDAPTMTEDGVYELADTDEDTASDGTMVSEILAGVGYADVDSGAASGIAVTDTTGNGTWEYSNDGVTWTAFGPVSEGSALLLDSTALVRYVPDGKNGETASFSFRAWDQTEGSIGEPADTTSSGGTTAFSTAIATVSITVTDLNDPPVLDTSKSPTLTAIDEDAGPPTNGSTEGSTLVSDLLIGATDLDGDDLGIAITGVNADGTLWYSLDDGATWTQAPANMQVSNALLLAGDARIYFQPKPNVNGTIGDAITFRAWDQTRGSNGGTGNAAQSGDGAVPPEFSRFTDTASITIKAVNDAPILKGGGALPAVYEDTTNPSGAALSSLEIVATDPDTIEPVGGYAIVGNAADATTEGVWQYSTDGGTNWHDIGAVSDTDALALSASTLLRFVPVADFNGEPGELTIRAIDNSYKDEGGEFSSSGPTETRITVDTSEHGGKTAFSEATATIVTSINPVNDAPEIAEAPENISVIVNEEVALTGISFADVDAGESLVTVTLSVPSGALAATSGDNVIVGGDSSELTLTGTIADINAFIAASEVTYTTTSDSAADVILTITINDNGNTGSGGARQDSAPVTLRPSVRPSIDIGTGSPSHVEDADATVVAPNLKIADGDSTTLSGATVRITDFVTGDVLSFTDQNGITGSYDAASGVLTLSGEATLEQYEAALRSVTYSTTHDNPATGAGNGNRVIEFRVSDGSLESVTGTTQTVSVTNANDAPVLDATQSPTLTGIEEDAAAPVNGSTQGSTLVSDLLIGMTDVDTDVQQGIAIIGVSEQGTLWYSLDVGATWTQVGAVSESNALLLHDDALIYFQPAKDVNGTIDDAITFRAWDRTGDGTNGGTADTTVNDGGTPFSSAIDTASVAIEAVNDAPTVSSAPTLIATEDAALTITAADLNFADVDTDDSLQSITVTSLATQGILFLDTNGNGTVDADEAITAGQTIAVSDIDAGRLKYIAAPNGNGKGYATFEYTVSDGIASSAPATATIDVEAVNDAPTATGMSQSHSATEDGAAIELDDIVVADVDGHDTITATLTLSDPAAGSLSTGTFGAATSMFDATTGVWTVTGSVADVNAAMAAVTLTLSADYDRSFTIATRIRDAVGTGPADGTIEVSVTPVNDAPIVTVPTSIDVTEDVASALTGVGFADTDAGTNAVTVTLGVPSGSLAATSGGGVTVGGTGSSLTFTGTIDAINAFIAAGNVTFTTDSNATQSVTLTVSINDNGNTDGAAEQGSATVTLNVIAVNDAPVVTAPSDIAVVANESVALTGISFDDVDAGANAVTVTLTVPSGTLAATSGDNVIVGGDSSTLTLTGTIADINAFIAASKVTFAAAPDSTADVTLMIEIDDNGNTGSGGAQQNSATVTLSTSDRPTIEIGGGSPSHTEDGSATVVAPNLSIEDSDSANLAGATVRITDFVAGDQLNFTNQNGISGSYDAQSGVLTLSGTATKEQYQAALRSITYSTTNDNPATGAGNGNRVIEFRVSDGSLESVAGTTQTVTVSNANDAPVLDASQSPTLTGIDEDAPAPTNGSTKGSTLVSALLRGVTDVDTDAQLGIAITGVSEQGTLWYSLDNGATWTQAGAVSEGNALLLQGDARLYFQPNANVNGTIADAITFRAWDRTSGVNGGTGDTTANGGTSAFSSTSDTASVTVAPVNDAPSVTAPGSLSVVATIPSAITGIVFADVDAGTDAALVTLSVEHGSLAASSGDGVIVSGGGTQLTLSGAISAINALIAAQRVSYIGARDALFDQTLSITIDDGGHHGKGGAQQASTSMVIQVASPNAAPTVDAPSTIQITEDIAAALTQLNIDDPDGDSITVTLSVSGGTLTGASSDTIVVSGGGTTLTLTGPAAAIKAFLNAGGVSYTPATNATADQRLTLAVSDGELSATASVTLDIVPVNDVPVPSGVVVPAIEGQAGHALSVTLPSGLFTDVEDGTALSLSVQNLPPGLTFDPSTRTIFGTPTVAAVGRRQLTIIATDSAGATASIAVTISIAPLPPLDAAPPPAAPPVNSAPPQVSAPSVSQSISTGASSTSQPISASPSLSPPSVSTPSSTSTLLPGSTARPSGQGTDALASGVSGFVALESPSSALAGGVSDIVVQAEPADVTVRIGEPDAPGLSFALPERTFVVFGQMRTTITATLADGRTLPSWVQFNPVTGMFTVNPPAGESGTLEIRVTATTDTGHTAAVEFEIRLEAQAAEADNEAVQPEETAAVPAGKPSLSEQLRAAGHGGVLAEVVALIESLVGANEVA